MKQKLKNLRLKVNPLLVFMVVSNATLAQNKVEVNLDVKHSVGGVSIFERSKWMNIHSANYEGDWGGEQDKMKYLLNDLDTYLGRETGFTNTEVTNNTPQQMVSRSAEFNSTFYARLTDRHQYENHQRGIIMANQHGVFDALPAREAGRRSAAFLNNYFGSGGANGMPRPPIFELLNEPVFPLHGLRNTKRACKGVFK